MTGPKPTVSQAAVLNVTQSMVAGGMSPEDAKAKAEEKQKETHRALRNAVIWACAAVPIIATGAFAIVRLALADKGLGILIVVGVAFLAAAAVPLFIAGYIATEASSEFMKIYLGMLVGFISKVRGKKDDGERS